MGQNNQPTGSSAPAFGGAANSGQKPGTGGSTGATNTMPGQGVNTLPASNGMMSPQPTNLATGPQFNAQGNALRYVPGMNQLPGGPQAPSSFQTPVGPVEQFMNATLRGGPGGNSFMSALLNGQIPPGMLAQFKDQQLQNNAQIADSMGGSRFGSDYAGAVSRENNRGLNTLLANTEGMGTGAFNAVSSPLLSSEVGRSNQAFQAQQTDFQNQQNYPLQLLSLLMGLGSMGGGSTTGGGSGTQTGINF